MKVFASDFIVDNNYIWFVPLYASYLICFDYVEKKTVKKIKLDIKNDIYEAFYEKVIKIDEKIIGIPYLSERIFVYDIKNENLVYFDVDEYKNNNQFPDFYASIILGGNIYSFSRWVKKDKKINNSILNIDLSGNKASLMECENMPINEAGCSIRFRKSFCIVDGSIFLLQGNGNVVAEYKPGNNRFTYYSLGNEEKRYTTIAAIDEKEMLFCLVDNLNNLVIWNKKTNSTKRLKIYEGKYEISDRDLEDMNYENYSYSVKNEKKIFFFPFLSGLPVIEYDYDKNEACKAFFSDEVSSICNSGFELERRYICGQFSEPHIEKGKIFIWNNWNKTLFVVDLQQKTTNRIDMEISFSEIEEQDICGNFMKWKLKENSHEDEGICGLNSYLKYVLSIE